jgi:hypothetical protein
MGDSLPADAVIFVSLVLFVLPVLRFIRCAPLVFSVKGSGLQMSVGLVPLATFVLCLDRILPNPMVACQVLECVLDLFFVLRVPF